ncbi:RNA-guided endonuclease InsQ/TnpB family protein [Aliarcobacter butzleri]|uniref:RNA-guided endonuclease InsQ/TnpB family protein n=1 Tax=Aliarcobacter butzleri TaxID=28197 RepID=UPI0021B325DF|nr:transposase [Aliarcobacter butzleri]MCT7593174.1 transposase [Aliarcobacter butzleri]MCT7633082.1 transposase [Aliarcobacter butzleri]
MKNEKTVNLGYKYRLYPTKDQINILNHQMYIYNQAYNICLNLWQKENDKNKDLPKEDRVFRNAVSYDTVIKRALRLRKLSFSSVVTQQARINFLKAVKKAFSKETIAARLRAIENATTPKEKTKAFKLGMPTFKSSRGIFQSFNWNNQGYQILYDINNNSRFKTLRLLKTNFRFRYHRKFPNNYKLSSITISKDSIGYYVSFGIEFKKQIDLGVSKDNLDISKSIGIDLNAYNFAVSANVTFIQDSNISKVTLNHLIDNGATNRKGLKYAKYVKLLERKQSRRVLKELKNSKVNKTKIKLGSNHKKTQKKLNKLTKRIANQKIDLYHKITTQLTNKFDLIVVEDLKTKNMSKSSKGNEITHGKRVKQKSGLNRTILNASFYQFVSMIQYKTTMLNDKLFVKVNPQYTSQECSNCGNIDKANRSKQDKFKCTACGFETNPDIQASKTILKRGLESFGLGTSLVDLKHKAFRSTSSEVAS